MVHQIVILAESRGARQKIPSESNCHPWESFERCRPKCQSPAELETDAWLHEATRRCPSVHRFHGTVRADGTHIWLRKHVRINLGRKRGERARGSPGQGRHETRRTAQKIFRATRAEDSTATWRASPAWTDGPRTALSLVSLVWLRMIYLRGARRRAACAWSHVRRQVGSVGMYVCLGRSVAAGASFPRRPLERDPTNMDRYARCGATPPKNAVLLLLHSDTFV